MPAEEAGPYSLGKEDIEDTHRQPEQHNRCIRRRVACCRWFAMSDGEQHQCTESNTDRERSKFHFEFDSIPAFAGKEMEEEETMQFQQINRMN